MKYFLYIIACISLFTGFSCSPEKKLQRLIKKYPELLSKDTIIDVDTFITSETRIDSVFSLVSLRDTVTIEKEKLKIKLLWKHDSIYVSGEIKPDTIFKTEKIPFEKIVVKENDSWFSLKSLWIGILAVLSLLFFLAYRRL